MIHIHSPRRDIAKVLYQIPEAVSGTIIKRPSLVCRSPYMADAVIYSESGGTANQILAHTPSLGCCGLAEKERDVILSKIESATAKSSHRVELAIHTEGDNQEIVGINPKLSETIAERCLQENCIDNLMNIRSYKREVTFLNSRFDFAGVDETGREFVMEIKSVPLADYVDAPKKEKKKLLNELSEKDKQFHNKIAYFPDGYRKNNTDLVSPRALKHIQELQELVETTDKRGILCFLIQRSDATSFQPSNIDPLYKHAVQTAWKNGVEIKTVQVKWDKNGTCTFVRNDLPIHLFDRPNKT
jgi:DNA-binding sugar fermentation-stimulating protein